MSIKRELGIVAALLLTMGTFAPLVDVFGITTNYYNNGEGDGSMVLILVVIMLLMTPFPHRKWVRRASWVVVILILSIIAIDFVDTIDRIGFNNMSWGWLPLIGGGIMAVVASAWPVGPRNPDS